MKSETLLISTNNHITTITLNRPEVRNAFNEVMINELSAAIHEASADDQTRVIVLNGAGKAFCAGGDLNWMKASVHASHEQNTRDAHFLSQMLQAIDQCPKPVVASVHGSAMGGGTGVIAACDYVVTDQETLFAFSEVKLGLLPAVIGPFVIAKIGYSQARALFLTGEKFDTHRAIHIGLVHEIAHHEKDMQDKLNRITAHLLSGGPQAQAHIKKYLSEIKTKDGSDQHDYAVDALSTVVLLSRR